MNDTLAIVEVRKKKNSDLLPISLDTPVSKLIEVNTTSFF